MSGVKKATVTNSLNKTLNIIRKGLEQTSEQAMRVGNTGRKELDRKRTEVEKVVVNREIPSNLRSFLKGEIANWESLLKRYDASIHDANGLYLDAAEKLQEYGRRKMESDRKIDSIQNKANNIRNQISWKSGYCDSENIQANALRKEAESVVNTMKTDSRLSIEAQGLSQKSFAKFSEAANLARLAQQEYDRLLNLGRDRMEKERIREENERNAKLLSEDLRSLKNRIESKNYTKFGKGTYSENEQQKIAFFESLISRGEYEQALNVASGLKTKLVDVAETIENEQLAWETAKAKAEKALTDAQEEIAELNRGEIAMYSGVDANEVQASFELLSNSEGLIQMERFSEAEANIAKAMKNIRDIVELTMSNKEATARRLEIAQCIMQALYDSNYDEPKAYLEEDGNELSDIHIVASAPGNVADMDMQVNLEGKVSFEVKNIPEGQEQLCMDAIRNLQDNMGEDFGFDVTDWGRAKNPPPKYDFPKTTQTVVKEKTRTGSK